MGLSKGRIAKRKGGSLSLKNLTFNIIEALVWETTSALRVAGMSFKSCFESNKFK